MHDSLQRPARPVTIRRYQGAVAGEEKDFLAAEDPLEIQVEGRSVAVVMRTPGDDRELAAGFLVTEGLLRCAADLKDIHHRPHCLKTDSPGPPRPGSELLPSAGNVINIRLSRPEAIDFTQLTRHVFTSSSCGICSKASIAAVQQQFPPLEDDCEVAPQVLMNLPAVLDGAQETFKKTGGLHACALFDLKGNLLVAREDVGRHNALDKVIGWALLADHLPLRGQILLLSGRASFEMMQKALAAGIAIVAAVSAPSSLAVEFAGASGQTLVGFLRGNRMNVYAGGHRLSAPVCRPDDILSPPPGLLIPACPVANDHSEIENQP